MRLSGRDRNYAIRSPFVYFFFKCYSIIVSLSGILIITMFGIVLTRRTYRKPVEKYPSDTQYFVTDFFVRGCKNFIENCPSGYKVQQICARSYNGSFRDFANYCEMQYENCNTWRNWRVYKRERC